VFVDGPARRIFAGKGFASLDALPPLDGFDLILTGTSAAATLERDVLRGAGGVRTASWLDHWIGYRERFDDVLPDELWVADEHAAALARRTVPGPQVKLMGNPHLEDTTAAIRRLETPHAGEHVLYVAEPTSVSAQRLTGDPMGFGYEERATLRAYLERERPEHFRLRTHPTEPADKYGLPASTASLEEDIAWADTVVGCDTMAMVVALYAGRRVVSVIPAGGRPLSLPFPAIERRPV
jgi:hypothetical protein